ncbi:MAG TPA: hypothetical protein VI168_15720 [Croceibacterium sp.]
MIESWLERLLQNGLSNSTVNAINILLALLAGIFGYVLVSRPAARQALRVERSQAYMQLEIASIDIFKYKAEKAYSLYWSVTEDNFKRIKVDILREEVDQYYYQCLNLFEVASRFRNAKIIDKEIYASWVAWFYEVLEVGYFREQWEKKYRDNYTKELQDIFDGGIALWNKHADVMAIEDPQLLGRPGPVGGPVDLLRREFYEHVGWVIACPVIARWLTPPNAPFGWLGQASRWFGQLRRRALRLKRPTYVSSPPN